MTKLKRKIKLTDTTGFTLVEAMVTMLIFSVLAGGLFAVLRAGDNSWQTNQVKVELQQDLRKAIEWMKDDLREAGTTSIEDVPADGSWHTSITFKTPSGISGGTLVWNTDTIQFITGGTGGTQLLRISGGVTKVIAQYIQLVQFRRQPSSSDILEIQIQGQKDTVQGNIINYQLDYKVQLRN